jgi:CcmD family protein
MMSLRRLAVAFCSFLLLSVPALALQPPPGQSEFVPIKDLPPTDQLPAAPYLITAYAFVWLAVVFYLWTIWRRLNKVETEMHALAQKTMRR